MKRAACLLLVLFALLTAGRGTGHSEDRDLYPGTPDEVIVKRAGDQAPPLWQIPLGPALVEDMRLLGSDQLLISLKKDFPGLPNLDMMLVDTAKGQVLWRYSRDKIKGRYDCLLILQDLLLFRVARGKTTTLLALDPRNGREKWTADMKGDRVMFIPFIGGSTLSINPGTDSVDLTALDLEGGRTLWQKSFRVKDGAELPVPQTVSEDIFTFYNGLERLSSKSGKSVFLRSDLVFDANSPPPRSEDGVLWAVHSGGRLSALDAVSGSTKWSVGLPSVVKYTNIYPMGDKIYLRGVDASGRHQISSLSRADGRILWTYSGIEPSISNLIESGGALYFGTPTSLVALDAGSGKQVFSVLVTTTGRVFPIHLRKIDDRLIYIGELVVAAFNAKTGVLVYKQGMTPGSAELHLNGLDAAAPNLKEEMTKASRNPAGDLFSSRASFASKESERYQNLTATYRSEANYFRRQRELKGSWSERDLGGYQMASMKQGMAMHESRLESIAAFAYAAIDAGIMIHQFFVERSIKTAVERQELFRKSILASCAQAETGEYLYRPHLVYRDAADNFHAVSVVHLPTGKRSETVLSPSYLSYGLWQVIDFDKGVVYHSDIGMDPSRYELSDARSYYPYKSARTINTFLIAQPVKIPR